MKTKAPKNKRAEHVMRFMRNLHLRSDFQGQKFEPRPWQENYIYRPMFGKLKPGGKRAITKALLLLPRKSSKTYMAATICLYALLTFGSNQVILSAAASQDQAKRLFEAMVDIIRQDPALDADQGGLCEIIKSQSRIVCARTNSYYVAVSSGGKSAHGHEPTVVVLDELHSWTKPNHRELFAALTTGRGTRKEPLTIMISTQTSDRYSIAGEEFEYARQLKGRVENGEVIADGTIDNPSYLAVLYYLPADADWHNEKLWYKVSPALGDFIDIEEYREQHQLAKEMPSRAINFKTLYLNMPCDVAERWMPRSLWNPCGGSVDPKGEDLQKVYAFGALDLAPVSDLSSFTLLFPVGDKVKALSWSWCCKDDIRHRSLIEKVPYDDWRDKGFIIETMGSSTDFAKVRQDILGFAKEYRIRSIAIDPNNAFQLGQELSQQGLNVGWFRQGFDSMGPATARTEKLVRDKALVHGDNPVLNYCVYNIRCETNAIGLQRPSNKLRLRHEKIDAGVSLIMAVGLWMNNVATESSYERRARERAEAAKSA